MIPLTSAKSENDGSGDTDASDDDGRDEDGKREDLSFAKILLVGLGVDVGTALVAAAVGVDVRATT